MKFRCVFMDMPIWSPRLKREYTECEAWRERVVDRLVALRPDLVIVASAQELPVVVAREGTTRAARERAVRCWCTSTQPASSTSRAAEP